MFDGIGGISGGGATSVFLPSYPEPQRSDILDFLFKPNHGASLHILKVEIGGDAQSTDGSEASHMHTRDDLNYFRGYEWWLMKEAKKRNQNILLCGLAWAFPQWVSCNPKTLENCSNDVYSHPDVTADYIVKWLQGAKAVHGLNIDYVGCWNERLWDDNYLIVLRRALDENGFAQTKIVAADSADGYWGIASNILHNSSLANAVHTIGTHYPGTTSSATAQQTGKQLWASEEDSTYNNNVGAGCWARVINQNYVNGNMTASINWNLIASYMKGTNWYRAGLMSAMQPWNGAYGSLRKDNSWTVGPMVWATAHTTQFTKPGWRYTFPGGTSEGHLRKGGTYVSLTDPTTRELTIVIEKMSRYQSPCVRPAFNNFDAAPEEVSFDVSAFSLGSTMDLWETHWGHSYNDKTYEFVKMSPVPIINGIVTLNVSLNSILTLTTIRSGYKGAPLKPPSIPTLFPESHRDNFELCPIFSEARYFADQNGGFECTHSNDTHHIVMQQTVPTKPVTWGGDIRPHSLIGHRDAKNQSLVIDAKVIQRGEGVMLGVRMQGTDNSMGILWGTMAWPTNRFGIWSSIEGVDALPLKSGPNPIGVHPGDWHTYRMDVNGSFVNLWIDNISVIENYLVDKLTLSGHALIGTLKYGEYTQFDNIQLYSSYHRCGATPMKAGSPVSIVECNSEVGNTNGSLWKFDVMPNNGTSHISLLSNPKLCLGAVKGEASEAWWLELVECADGNDLQEWSWWFDGISPDNERTSFIYLPAHLRCLDVYTGLAEIGYKMSVWPCNHGLNQAFWFDHDAGELGNQATATCVGVC